MKLLIYTHAFSPQVGGAETLVMLLAQGMAEQLGQENNCAERVGNKGSVTVITFTSAGLIDDKTFPFKVVRRPNLGQLVRLIKGADVVHLAGPCFIPMCLGVLLRKRIVVEHHGFQAACPNGLLLFEPTEMPCPGHFMARRHHKCLLCNAKQGKLRSLKMWLLTFLRRRICHLVSVNIVLTEWLGTSLRLPRTKVIHCGIPTKANCIVPHSPHSSLTFAFVGRLVSAKGVHILLKAAHRLKKKGLSFHIKIIGDGPQRAILEAQAKVLNLNDCMTFMGYLPKESLEKTLTDVNAIIMPSLAGETFGLVAAENMALGRLLIVSDIGALSEVVDDAGLKFPPGDVNALTDCLQHVLERPALISELGMKARDRVLELFQQERMVEEHRRVYEQLMEN